MPASLTDTLCTKCGLCCDGSLFAGVDLARSGEVSPLTLLGLEVDANDTHPGLLSQPCPALVRRRCSIYAERPKCCRTFECGLLQDVRAGAVTVEQAGAKITEAFSRIRMVRKQLAAFGERDARLPLDQRCARALAVEAGPTPGMTERQAALADAVADLKKMLESTFFGRG